MLRADAPRAAARGSELKSRQEFCYVEIGGAILLRGSGLRNNPD